MNIVAMQSSSWEVPQSRVTGGTAAASVVVVNVISIVVLFGVFVTKQGETAFFTMFSSVSFTSETHHHNTAFV